MNGYCISSATVQKLQEVVGIVAVVKQNEEIRSILNDETLTYYVHFHVNLNFSKFKEVHLLVSEQYTANLVFSSVGMSQTKDIQAAILCIQRLKSLC